MSPPSISFVNIFSSSVSYVETTCTVHLVELGTAFFLTLVCSQLKESKRTVNNLRDIVDDDDELEKFSWSGEPVGSKYGGNTKVFELGALVKNRILWTAIARTQRIGMNTLKPKAPLCSF